MTLLQILAMQIPTRVHGLPLHIETPAGQLRTIKNDQGKVVWQRHQYNHYGEIKNTKGRDGDPVDVFVGPLGDAAKEVYIVHMIDKGPYVKEREDEDKVMIGFPSADAAKQAFIKHYPANFFGGMTILPVAVFKKRLKEK